MLKEFFERNKSIFNMGILIAVIFLILIIASSFRQQRRPGLRRIEESDPLYTVSDNNDSYNDDLSDQNSLENIPETQENTQAYEAFDEEYGIVEITYEENGFIPKNYRAYKGQLVRWLNTTDEPIYLEQKMKYYSELEEPVKIDPNSTFELRMEKDKLWTFQERDTKNFGSVFVVDPE